MNQKIQNLDPRNDIFFSHSLAVPFPQRSSRSPWRDKPRLAHFIKVSEDSIRGLKTGLIPLYQFLERSSFSLRKSWGHAYRPFTIDVFGPITSPDSGDTYHAICIYKDGGEDFSRAYERQMRRRTNPDSITQRIRPNAIDPQFPAYDEVSEMDIVDNTAAHLKILKVTPDNGVITLADLQYRRDNKARKNAFFVKVDGGLRLERLEIPKEVINCIVTDFSKKDRRFYDGCIQPIDRPRTLRIDANTPKWGIPLPSPEQP